MIHVGKIALAGIWCCAKDLGTRFARQESGGVPTIRDRVGQAHLRLKPHALRWACPTRPLTACINVQYQRYNAQCQRSQGGVFLRGRGLPTERGMRRPGNAVCAARNCRGAKYPRPSRAGPSAVGTPRPSMGLPDSIAHIVRCQRQLQSAVSAFAGRRIPPRAWASNRARDTPSWERGLQKKLSTLTRFS